MNFKVDPLGLSQMPPGPQGSMGDPQCIFFTLKSYQTTLLVPLCDTMAGIADTHMNTHMVRQTDVDVEIGS